MAKEKKEKNGKKDKKGFIQEFKEFIMRGNVMDMAIGVILATAFGSITTSLVDDVCMPAIGLLIGGIDLSKLDIVIKEAVMEGDTVVSEAVVIGIGSFITTVINFLLVALIIFLVIKFLNRLSSLRNKGKEEEAVEEAPPEPTKEELLLTEIRDLLKKDG